MTPRSNVVPLRASRPSTQNGKVTRSGPLPPPRVRNQDRRAREHLAPAEVDRMVKAAGSAGRHSQRDSTLLLVAYRHGLRVSELVALRWDQVDFTQGLLHVSRLKNGVPSTHLSRTSQFSPVV